MSRCPPGPGSRQCGPGWCPTHILSSMQYTADGRDLLGAFTRATFCTVVSSSPEDRGYETPGCPAPTNSTGPLGDPQSCAVGVDGHQAHCADGGNGDKSQVLVRGHWPSKRQNWDPNAKASVPQPGLFQLPTLLPRGDTKPQRMLCRGIREHGH